MHKGLVSTFSILTAAILLSTSSAASTPPAPADDPRLGWHGEIMPEGMERGSKQGEYLWAKDNAVMVYVPPGPFLMGTDKGEPTEGPAHEVDLDGFYIDKHEVSWRLWKASGLPYSPDPDRRVSTVSAPDWGLFNHHPVVMVSWDEAKTYAAQFGKRLPTEAEWEKAARGTDGRDFPWGNSAPAFDQAIWEEHPISFTSTGPVNCCPAGASPYGATNMAGNVWEWCEDSYTPGFYGRSPRKNPINRDQTIEKIVRGGAMQLSQHFMRTYRRYWLNHYDRNSDLGFRTVVSAVPAPERPAVEPASPAPGHQGL
jgi:serine/threonine-protein kinase